MNYLGHLLLLPDRGLVTLGNLLGDFVKGRPEFVHPPQFRLGVRLHREIDNFADAHPIVRRSKTRMAPKHRRIAGILIDVFYDHFLAQNLDVARFFPPLEPFLPQLPAPLQSLPARMIAGPWLSSYASIDGIAHVLARMDQRRARPFGLTGAESQLRAHYTALAADLADFYPDLERFTKAALLRLQSASPAEPQSDAATATASDPLRTS